MTQLLSPFRQLRYPALLGLLLAFSLSFSSCSRILQDQVSLDKLSMLKTTASGLINKAAEPYDDHKAEVEQLKTDMNDQIAYEKEKGKKNTKMVEMLQLLMKPDGNLLGGFLERWKNKGKMNPAMATEVSKIVSDNFDQIINLEKSKPTGN